MKITSLLDPNIYLSDQATAVTLNSETILNSLGTLLAMPFLMTAVVLSFMWTILMQLSVIATIFLLLFIKARYALLIVLAPIASLTIFTYVSNNFTQGLGASGGYLLLLATITIISAADYIYLKHIFRIADQKNYLSSRMTTKLREELDKRSVSTSESLSEIEENLSATNRSDAYFRKVIDRK